MGNLLIEEYPLMVLPTLAQMIGLNRAIVLQQVHYWLSHKTPDGRRMGKEVGGVRWIRNSTKDWHESNFKFWSLNTVIRAFDGLEEIKFLISRQDINTVGYDRTKWYTINYKLMDAIYPIWVNGINQFGKMDLPNLVKTIPETTRDYKIPLGSKEPQGDIFISKYAETKLHQLYGWCLKYRREGDGDYKDPRLYHPALRRWRGKFECDVTAKDNYRDRVIKAVGDTKASLDLWSKSMTVWVGISTNKNAPFRVLQIFENGGELNSIKDVERQNNALTQDKQVELHDPLSVSSLAAQAAKHKKLIESGILDQA